MCNKHATNVRGLEDNKKYSNTNIFSNISADPKAEKQPQKSTPLDTLAQLYENGKTRSNFSKRANAKFFTNNLVFKLANIKDSSLTKSYWNTYHCSMVLDQTGKKLKGKYCKCKWCQVCNRIRTAQLIKGYSPQLEALGETWFITLSRPNIDAELLYDEIDSILKQFNRVRRHFHDSKDSIVGLRKLECTFNPIRKDYHPHFHLIVKGDKMKAEAIRDYWLKINPNASIKGNDIRPVTSYKNGFLELFKYFTKLTTKTENGKYMVNAESLNVIFESMKGKRVFQPMGIKKVTEEIAELQTIELSDLTNDTQRWLYDERIGDWVNENGLLLTENKVSKELCTIVGVNYDEYCHNRDTILYEFQPNESLTTNMVLI